MLKLRWERRFASITSFPNIELPDLTIITGPNGSGKTHLLRAIMDGAILTDCTGETRERISSEIKYFDSSIMTPINQASVTSDAMRNERATIAETFSIRQNELSIFGVLDKLSQQHGCSINLDNDVISKIFKNDVLALENFDIADKEGLMRNTVIALSDANRRIISNFDDYIVDYITSIANDLDVQPCMLSGDDILNAAAPNWGRSELFQHSFARLFVSYRDILIQNQLFERAASKGENKTFLSDEEFIAKYGPAPWDIVNEIFSKAGFSFTINSPSLYDLSPYSAALTKSNSNSKISFESLSSGEKIIISFAFCMYHMTDGRQFVPKPKILLFDEVDAPLHPSMSRSMLTIIEDLIVTKFGIKVIIVTHSPSTVALAPADSIFVMTSGVSGLQKKTKTGALNALMEGVPILAISFDGRRQVFVESNNDAIIYDKIYNIIKLRLNSERTLEFISTGTKNKLGDINTGCDIVKTVVKRLSDAGNNSVFGLIDWDGANVGTDRIHVLGESVRNGIENVILDPLMIGLLIFRDFRPNKSKIFGDVEFDYLRIDYKNVNKLQIISDTISSIVLRNRSESKVHIKYGFNTILTIDEGYTIMDDHELESRVLAAFPFLKRVANRGAGSLMVHIVDNVFIDHPDLIPHELYHVMEKLLNVPVGE